MEPWTFVDPDIRRYGNQTGPPRAVPLFWYGIHAEGIRKAGPAKQGKKVSGGHFFRPWENPSTIGHAVRRTVDLLRSGAPRAVLLLVEA